MLLRRTRARIALYAKDVIFRLGGFQALLDDREARVLSQHMGFRHQWEEHRRFQMAILQAQGLTPRSRVLEIGCGPLTLGVPLVAYLDKAGYTGLDVRPTVLDVAYGQLSKAGLAAKNPRLLHTESFGASELGSETFDFVWSFSVLFHLTDELLQNCFEQVRKRLGPGGAYYANINAEMPESTWLEFPFNRRDPNFYAALAKRNGLFMMDLGTIESLGFRLDAMEKNNRLLRFTAVEH